MESSFIVKLHIYDISGGMARQLSQSFIGKQVDGIWHTGIVVYETEYFFGGGICEDLPARTPFGLPSKTIELGKTEIPKEVFLDFLKEISPKFTFLTYDLFKNNCNNFTDECAQFLLGEGIPSYITGLPNEFLNTPLGKMLQPMITQITQGMTQRSHALFGTDIPQGIINTGSLTANNTVQTLPTESALTNVSSIEDFFGLIEEYPAAIVGCFSQTCPPCVRITPLFEALAKECATKCPEIKFIKVMVHSAPEIAQTFSVVSYPTFMGFFDGLQVEKFIGAYDAKLKELVDKLIAKVEASGKSSAKGEKFDFELFKPESDQPYLFTSENLSLPISKIQDLVEKDKVLSESSMKDAFNVFAKDPKQLMKQLTKDQKTYLVTWIVETLLYFGLNDKAIPFLELLRILCTDASYTEILVDKNAQADNLTKIFEPIFAGEDQLLELPKPLRLVLLRFVSNVAASKQGSKWLESNFEKGAKRTIDNSLKCLAFEPAAVTANLMLMMNLLQNLSESKALEQESNAWLEHLLQLTGKETDEKNLLPIVTNLCWLTYRVKAVRPTLQKSTEFLRIEQLKTSAKDSNLVKMCKDLERIVAKI